eukprot:58973-Amphidinium_carterae.1
MSQAWPRVVDNSKDMASRELKTEASRKKGYGQCMTKHETGEVVQGGGGAQLQQALLPRRASCRQQTSPDASSAVPLPVERVTIESHSSKNGVRADPRALERPSCPGYKP